MRHEQEFVMRAERLAVMHLIVETMLGFREAYFGTKRLHRRKDDTSILVSIGVAIGQAEGKPMGASKLAEFLHIPRTTVIAKLKRLAECGVVVEHDDHTYTLSKELAQLKAPNSHQRFARYRQLIRGANRVLGD